MQYSGNPNSQFDLDDFNLNSNETSWEAPARDLGALGNKIISTPDANNQDWGQSQAETESTNPELGRIVNLEMPPNSEAPRSPQEFSQQISPLAAPKSAYDKTAIKTTDKLSSRGVEVINQVIHKLNHDGNVANFYNEIRGEGGMMETNLKQSYNRTLGENN